MIDWENEEFNRKMLGIYKVTDDPLYCGWILPDGRMLNFIEGANGIHIMCHLFVEFVVGIKGQAAIDEFTSSGAIRHQHRHNAMMIKTTPTEAQLGTVAKVLMCHYKSGTWMSGRTQLHMKNGDKTFFNHYTLGENPSRIMDDVREFFGLN
jgi:hypothetical protein